jgi:hypothetical protein
MKASTALFPISHDLLLFKVKGEVKFLLERTVKSQRRSRGTAPLFLEPRRRMGWVINVTPRPFYPREKDPVPTIEEDG